MMKRIVTLSLTLSLFLSSCCSIIHGSKQDIDISSAPAGATVKVDGQNRGITPVLLQLEREKDHIIVIEKEGHQPQTTEVNKSVSGWVWGNLVFGGIIGLVVDYCTGAIWTLDPEKVNSALPQAQASIAQ